ncbi:MAG: type II secretion system GspH family protein [Pyrinomonadaceae bacterium]|nr:type II secretion system GspH family protein [Pyrinomonadaceae bacterium]
MNGKSNIANRQSQSGFTLLELIITLAVLAILVMGTIPITQNAVKRQKELQLREALREMRNAIDDFHRDTIGACNSGTQAGNIPGGLGGTQSADPRSRVLIDDCKIFDTENLDRYPPTLDILVEGVKVKARGLNIKLGGGVFDEKSSLVFKEDGESEDKKKVYLRELPVDPMTGEKDWKFRSTYQTKGDESWDEVNVFDVRSSSDGEALNGEKYSDW